MKCFGILLVGMLVAPYAAAQSPYSAFQSSEAMVVVAHLKALARSDDPLGVAQGGRLLISTGCGYDTAIVRVTEQLGGTYEMPELATHLELGESCTSFLQDQVKDYLLALKWNGTVWEIDAALSSRLLPDSSGELWLVEPDLVARLEEFGGPKARRVNFPVALLENLATGIEERRGAAPEPGASREAWLDELRTLRPVPGEWPSNPLHFRLGISLDELKTWLTANNSFKPNPLRRFGE